MSKIFICLNLVVIFLCCVQNKEYLTTTKPNNSAEDWSFTAGDPKIFGGSHAILEGNKHVVSIRSKKADSIFGKGHKCGGSLISSERILTAAHCFKDSKHTRKMLSANSFKVVMGSLKRFNKSSTTLEFYDIKYIYHAMFNTTTTENDIALVFITGYTNNFPHIKPIKLAKSNMEEGTMCVVSGWGYTYYEKGKLKQAPDNLMSASLELFSYNECKFEYRDGFLPGMICAGDWTAKRDVCIGDSGGPLICNSRQLGVLSWGRTGCGRDNYSSVYSDVVFYRSWILGQADEKLYIDGAKNKQIRITILIVLLNIIQFC